MKVAGPIVPVHIGDDARVVEVAQQILSRKILVASVRPPTVPSGTSRLRISLSAGHEPRDIEQLTVAITQCVT